MSATERKQLVLDYFQSLVDDDFGRMRELCRGREVVDAPTAQTRFGMPVPTVGVEEFLRLQRQGIEEIYHPREWQPHVLIAEGDHVAALVGLEAVTPNGATYRNTYLFLFEFKGERISQFWEFVDTAFVHDFLASVNAGPAAEDA